MKLDESLFQLPGLRHGLRFYVTGASPCPYLPGQIERKGFTHLTQDNPDALHDQLSRAGFRRSQGVAYRPACPACNACRSVRVDTARFAPSRNQRRILRANADLVRRPIEARASREQSITNNGHVLAMQAASAGINATAQLTHQLTGLGGLQSLKALDQSINDKLDELLTRLQTLHQQFLQTGKQWLLVGEEQYSQQHISAMQSAWRDFANDTHYVPPHF